MYLCISEIFSEENIYFMIILYIEDRIKFV